MRVTAKTITDEQIRDLRMDPATPMSDRVTCALALNEFGTVTKRSVRDARARCAEILNARSKEQP